MAEVNSQLKLLGAYAINLSVVRHREKADNSEALETRICESSMIGVGRDAELGSTVFTYAVQANTGLNTIGGLENGGAFYRIETGVRDTYFSSLGSSAKSAFSTYTAASLVGSYAAGTDYSELGLFLSGSYDHLRAYFGEGPSGQFFSDAQLIALQTAYGYSGALSEIFDGSPRNSETTKIFFKSYDLSESFSDHVILDRVRDSAILQYGISGELEYSPVSWDGIPECSEIEIPIFANNDTEVVRQNYYVGPATFPCIDTHALYRPITGVEFSRDFVDGPYSTGNWNQSLMDNFINREKSGLYKSQYSDNKKSITTFDGKVISPYGGYGVNNLWVNTELPWGEYQTPYDREKTDSPKDGQTTWFHVGNATGIRTGSFISGYARAAELNPGSETNQLIQVYRETDLGTSSTGIKFVPLRLKQRYWQSKFGDNVYNPKMSGDRVYQSALNFNADHFIDFNDPRVTSGIAGPPQRDDMSDLPYITFHQNFDSRVNNTFASVSLGYGQSASEKTAYKSDWIFTQFMMATTGSGGYSQTFSDDNHYRVDEQNQPSIDFQFTVKSSQLENTGLAGGLIKHNFFGMGNNLDGGYIDSYYIIRNAGLNLSGNNHYGVTGIPIETGELGHMSNMVLISGYSGYHPTRVSHNFCQDSFFGPVEYGSIFSNGCILGSTQKYDEYLIAWKHPTKGHVKVSKMYGYLSGQVLTEEFIYSGFSSGNTLAASSDFPVVPISEGFAANPYYSGLMASGWVPIKKRQLRANNHPRYWRGPYASARKKFLYPNAHALVTGSSSFGYVTGAGASLLSSLNKGSEGFYNATGERIDLEYPNNGFSQGVGFPHMVIFDMKVEEYATKEFYKKTHWTAGKAALNSTFLAIDSILPNVTWKQTDSFTPTNMVDKDYADSTSSWFGPPVMGYTGVNSLVYNSPPNFFRGFINDEIGYTSGGGFIGSYPMPKTLMANSGAYLSDWYESLSGTIYGGIKYKNPEGNYHIYKTYTRRCTGYYTPPAFRSQDSRVHTDASLRVWPETDLLGTSAAQPPLYGFHGADPLYYRRVSSVTGVTGVSFDINEEHHGGMHPAQLHGDSWMSFSYSGRNVDGTDYGYGHHFEPKNPHTYYHRDPEYDHIILMNDIRSSGLGIHFSALNVFPGTGRQGEKEVGDKYAYYKSGIYTGFGGNLFDISSNRKFSFIVGMETGLSFPIPSGSGWSGSGLGDNTIYPKVADWQRDHTGDWFYWRRASKMDVTYQNVRWSGYGQLPYDVEYLYQPSGQCRVFGKHTYGKLREAPIFSEGMFLTDISENDPIKTYGSYPQYLSDTLKDHGFSVTIAGNTSLESCPSRQLELKNASARNIYGDSDFRKINTQERDFNKYVVIAISDYSRLNEGVMPSYESPPPSDSSVFPNAIMLYSANKGQQFPDNTQNPYVIKKYEVDKQFQYYDAELTDASIDPRFVTKVVPVWSYTEPNNGQFMPKNVTIRESEMGLY